MASASHFLLLLGLTSGLLAAASGCDDAVRAPSCPPGWTQYGSRCFIFHMNYRTWLEAETFCIANGGNLASIHNLDEHFFIKNMIYRSAGYDYESWIGGFDAIEEGTWMWTDGSPFNYRRWYDSEPDNGDGYSSENCLETNVDDYFWGDETCDTENPFVCSRNAAV